MSWIVPVIGQDGAGRRMGIVAITSAVAGITVSFSLPPFGWWPLAFAGTALLWWRLGGLKARSRLTAGWFAGLGLFGPALFWALSFNVAGGIALILIESFSLAMACLLTPAGAGRTLALPSAMVICEWIRSSWPFGGLPMGSPALGQAAAPLGQTARLGGPLLVLGLLWLSGASLGSIVVFVRHRSMDRPLIGEQTQPRRRFFANKEGTGLQNLTPRAISVFLSSADVARSHSRPNRFVAMGVSLGLLVSVVAVAARYAPDGGAAIGTLKVASVQGGGVRGLRKSQVSPQTVFDAQVTATEKVISGENSTSSDPGLVLWPEDVVSLTEPLSQEPGVQRGLETLAKDLKATLVVGVTENVSQTAFRNEAVAYSPNGKQVATYEKVHRVPFGEYVPDRSFFGHFANLSEVPLNAVPGTGDGLMRTPAGPLGTMISYEVFFSDRGRIPTRAGARLLIVPTNTSSYSTSQVPSQEIAASQLQAISEGRDLVQAAPTGFSAIVDNRGKVISRSGLGVQQILESYVSLRDGHTVYEETGDMLIVVLAVILLLASWTWNLTERRRD